MYNHPYEPYEIQVKFMDILYSLLTGSKCLGIFESPTGTGKTLSLLCPSITWLRNQDKIELEEKIANLQTIKGPPFVKVAAKKKLLREYQEKGEALKELASRSQARVCAHPIKKHRKDTVKKEQSTSSQYLLEDPIVDEATDKLINEFLDEPDPILDKLVTPRKIFFASRTHSQLTQFVAALKPMKLEASWSDSKAPIKHVPLASRKQLCTNPEVTGSAQQINDQCSDLRKKHACPYFENHRQELSQDIIANVMDIEELASAGRELKACSYYAARETVPYAEVVTLPYQLLVDENTRKALKIDLKDSLVIIDEAHNIMDVITSINSLSISYQDVQSALQGLETYKRKVGQRLSLNNKNKLAQTISVVESLVEFFQAAKKLPAAQTAPGRPVDVSQLFTRKNIEMVNLWDLKKWFKESKLVFKLDSYIKNEVEPESRTQLVLGRVVDFLEFATDPSKHGKLFFDKHNDRFAISFLSLDPSPPFKHIVDQASKVVLAGGTMEPVSDYMENLVPDLDLELIQKFSCGHVIPERNLMVRIIDSFEFTFTTRNNKQQIQDLGRKILDLCKVAPAGFVVFFPSYGYLDQVLGEWRNSGVYRQLDIAKKIFTEDKSKSVEKTLEEYAKQVPRGALMFAVVGGKLSEGINFSDDLARAVAMVGLPFPNAFSAEMVAKKEFIEQRQLERGQSKAQATQAAKEQYENISMRAVNQSVGRAIRHIGDYAAIYLFDTRYQQPRIRNKLSGWLRDAVKTSPRYIEDTREFFGSFSTKP